MAGDVFGNGMLLSRQIRLVAAFNHQHIFLDPNPDAETSFGERARCSPCHARPGRLRHAPDLQGRRHPSARGQRHLPVPAGTRPARDRVHSVDPQEIIRAILRLPVDLLWNGGIGTYVKASWEANSAIGDRTNDAVRVDGGPALQGDRRSGNLGCSQLAHRVRAARRRLNTDFVDNSGAWTAPTTR